MPADDLNLYIVLDDFGQAGRAYRETDEAQADLETGIDSMMTGQYHDPVRVVGFNTSEAWSRDVSEDVAWEVLTRLRTEGKSVPRETRNFLEWHVVENEVAMVEHFVYLVGPSCHSQLPHSFPAAQYNCYRRGSGN